MELLSVTMNEGIKRRSEIEGKDNSSDDNLHLSTSRLCLPLLPSKLLFAFFLYLQDFISLSAKGQCSTVRAKARQNCYQVVNVNDGLMFTD